MKIRLLCNVPCDGLKRGEVYDTIGHYEKHAIIKNKAGKICYIPITRYEPVEVDRIAQIVADLKYRFRIEDTTRKIYHELRNIHKRTNRKH